MTMKNDSRRPFKKSPINQVHLERIESNQWHLIVSDAIFFFKPKYVDKFRINRSALEKLLVEIERELDTDE